MEPRPSDPDFQLVWPRALFRRVAADLLNTRDQPDWDECCELLLTDAFAGGSSSGPASDLRDITRQANERSVRAQNWGTTPRFTRTASPVLTPGQAYLRQLMSIADQLHEDPPRRAYWKDRRASAQVESDAQLLSTAQLAHEFVRLVAELDEPLKYFDRYFETDCVDCPRGDGPSLLMERELRENDLWPLDAARLSADEDLLYSVIEWLHDHTARPSSPGTFHSYAECGWHRSGFDVDTGRSVYRWRVNKLLSRSNSGLRLADNGEDIGRLVAATDQGRTELVTAVTSRSDSGPDDQVRHAVALFRSRAADRHHKRSAVVELAHVLEERRHTVLETALPKKDRGALFQIANEFNIRHQDAKQKSDYDDFYLDWVFWLFLSTVELTSRILDESKKPAANSHVVSPPQALSSHTETRPDRPHTEG